ncbi:hypothetical protein HNR73_002084 [Phytomonospora endophytica]|uniref:Uncharacterized protein n=1 Tax=Phytomonospora endophytica TaxID=714109 RepID=A0A841FEH0_9ACTN|nr:hypothetical protein [Phytomonospora endophytica]GIG66627.1 hypothetical protein Pen01_29220 [Phytomonospora endophytica]
MKACGRWGFRVPEAASARELDVRRAASSRLFPPAILPDRPYLSVRPGNVTNHPFCAETLP